MGRNCILEGVPCYITLSTGLPRNRHEAHTTEDHRYLLAFPCLLSRTGRRDGNGLTTCTDGFMTLFLAIVGPLHPYPELAQAFLVAEPLHRFFCSLLAPNSFPRLITCGWTHGRICSNPNQRDEEKRERRMSKRHSRLGLKRGGPGNDVYELRGSGTAWVCRVVGSAGGSR